MAAGRTLAAPNVLKTSSFRQWPILFRLPLANRAELDAARGSEDFSVPAAAALTLRRQDTLF
jgi:hypothetical protein